MDRVADDIRPNPSWGKRLRGIEGLRGVAALSVMIGHVHGTLTPGIGQGALGFRLFDNLRQGLTLFFVLSGFLLFRPFATSLLSASPSPSVKRYFRNRALRIVPAYVVIFLISSYIFRTTFVTGGGNRLPAPDSFVSLGPITNVWDLLANLSMFQTAFPQTIRTGISTAWSLTPEVTFYVALPILVWIAFRVRARIGNGIVAAAVVPAVLMAIGMAGNVWAQQTLHGSSVEQLYQQSWGMNWHSVLERSFLTQAPLFAVGCAIAVLVSSVEIHEIGKKKVAHLRLAVAVAGLGLSAWAFRGIPRTFAHYRLNDFIWAVAFGALVAFVAIKTRHGRSSGLAKILDAKFPESLGLCSYSVYLWHLPVIWWLSAHDKYFSTTTPLGFAGNCVLVMAIVCTLSLATYRFVELPALRKKARTDKPSNVITVSSVNDETMLNLRQKSTVGYVRK